MVNLFGKNTCPSLLYKHLLFVLLSLRFYEKKAAQSESTHSLSADSSHTLRYVLRNQETKELLFCVSFTLVPVDEEAKKHMEEQTGKKLNTVDEHHASEDTKKGGDYEDEGVD